MTPPSSHKAHDIHEPPTNHVCDSCSVRPSGERGGARVFLSGPVCPSVFSLLVFLPANYQETHLPAVRPPSTPESKASAKAHLDSRRQGLSCRAVDASEGRR